MKKTRLFILPFVLLGLFLLGACQAATAVSTTTSIPATAVPPTSTAPPTATAIESEVATVAEPTPTATPDPLRTFVIDDTQSTVGYRVEEEFLSGAVTALGKELGLFTAVGSTDAIEGQFQLLENESGGLTLVGGEVSVHILTLRSDEHRRDERIRDQFLESRTYPFADFTVTSVEGFPETYTEGEEITFFLTGDMTIREITNSETFTLTARLEGNTITGTGITQIYMVDYGFDPPEIAGYLVALDPATVEIELVAIEGELPAE